VCRARDGYGDVHEVLLAARWDVEVQAVTPVLDVPGRVTEHGLVELVEVLGEHVADGEDVWAALTRACAALPETELAERLLEVLLLQPPIPAYCEALVAAMHDAEHAPWRTHEVPSDRVALWTAHRILHGALPDRFPAPTLRRVDLRVHSPDPGARAPGHRASPRDRTAFAARLLASRPGAHPMSGHGQDIEWAFDALWAIEIEDASASRTVSAWLQADLIGDLAAGAAWSAELA
jgi:hypothetical protein